MTSPVRYDRTGPVATVTIDRPAERNAIDRRAGTALRESFARLDGDDEVDVGVVTGAGGTFCAGANLDEFVGGATLEDREHGFTGFSHLRTAEPLVAAIEGHAVGGGLELALFCDLRVAARSAVLGCLERRVGAPLLDGGTQRLPRVVGLGRAMDVILTGREVDADEAHDWGLVDRVVEDGETLATAVDLGETIAGFHSTAVRTDRRAVYDGLGAPRPYGLAIESWRGLHALPAARDGARRFAESGPENGEEGAD